MIPKCPVKSSENRIFCSIPQGQYPRRREYKTCSIIPSKVTRTHQNYLTEIWNFLLNNPPEKLITIPEFLSPDVLRYLCRNYKLGNNLKDRILIAIDKYQNVLNFHRIRAKFELEINARKSIGTQPIKAINATNKEPIDVETLQFLNTNTLRRIFNGNLHSNHSQFLQKLAIIDKTIRFCSMDPVTSNALALTKRIEVERYADSASTVREYQPVVSKENLHKVKKRRNRKKLVRNSTTRLDNRSFESIFNKNSQLLDSMNSASEICQKQGTPTATWLLCEPKALLDENSEYSSTSDLSEAGLCYAVQLNPQPSTSLRTEVVRMIFLAQEATLKYHEPLHIQDTNYVRMVSSELIERNNEPQLSKTLPTIFTHKMSFFIKNLLDESDHKWLLSMINPHIHEEASWEHYHSNYFQNVCHCSDLCSDILLISIDYPLQLMVPIELSRTLDFEKTQLFSVDYADGKFTKEGVVELLERRLEPRMHIKVPEVISRKHFTAIKHSINESDHKWLPLEVNPFINEEASWEHYLSNSLLTVSQYSDPCSAILPLLSYKHFQFIHATEVEYSLYETPVCSISRQPGNLYSAFNHENRSDEFFYRQWTAKTVLEGLRCIQSSPSAFGVCMDENLNHYVEISHRSSAVDCMETIRRRFGGDTTWASSITEGDWDFDRSNNTNITIPTIQDVRLISERIRVSVNGLRRKRWVFGHTLAITCLTTAKYFFWELGTGDIASILGAIFACLTVTFVTLVKLSQSSHAI